MECMRPDCDAPATTWARAKWDRMWWRGCAIHAPAMIAALYLGINSNIKEPVEVRKEAP